MIFYLLLTGSLATYVGDALCTGLTTATCGTTALLGQGWCYVEPQNYLNLSSVSSSCQILPCYLIDEVQACRTSAFTGGASSLCVSLETFSLQYDNVCGESGDTQMNYAFVRFAKTSDGYVDQTSDATPIPIATLDTSSSVKNMFKLYTINAWLAAKQTTEALFTSTLGAILDKYADSVTSNQLLTQQRSHPFYMERLVYQSLQMLRDWTVQNKSPVALRTTLLPKIWTVAHLALTRMTSFQPNYYYTNYYFVNFATIPYYRQEVTMDGQMHSLKINWSTYSYTSNGYVMIYSYAPHQFGITGQYTDVLCVRPFLGSTVAHVAAENNYDNTFGPLMFTYYWSDTSLTITQANLRLYRIDKLATTITDTGATFTCVTASRYCTTSSSYTPVVADGTGENYFIGDVTIGDIASISKKRAQCLLSYHTWTIGTSTCA